MKITKVGWGAGTKNLPIPNVLKVYEGCALEGAKVQETDDLAHDEIVVLEANIDDCSGEILGYAMDVLMENGALDVSYMPIFMKKNRPAYRLTVLVKPDDEQKLERMIFKYTTTIGIRKRKEIRSVLKRKAVTVSTPYGELKAKKVFLDGEERIYPEYQSAVELAEQSGLALWEIYRSYEF